jgi:hypothetical protein
MSMKNSSDTIGNRSCDVQKPLRHRVPQHLKPTELKQKEEIFDGKRTLSSDGH